MMKPRYLAWGLLSFVCCCGCMQRTEQRIITIENEVLRVVINKTGAELWSILGKDNGVEYLWQGDPQFWSGRAPIMFPVNVRFEDEQFTYRGKTYDMPRMGLAKDADFIVIPSASPDTAVMVFESSDRTLRNYPFPFRLQVTYRLRANELVNEFKIQNTAEEELYFALGGHPGIRCPLQAGRHRGDYQIIFPEKRSIKRIKVENSLVHPQTIPWLRDEDCLGLDDARIPDGGMFVKNSPFNWVGVGLKDQEPFVRVELGNFPNVNIWTPPGYPFVCIEPMISHHDIVDSPLDIEQKSHLISLPPGESRDYYFKIIIGKTEDY